MRHGRPAVSGPRARTGRPRPDANAGGPARSGAKGFRSALAEEAGRTEDEDQDEQDEVEDLLPGRADQVRACDFDRGYDEAAEHRPEHVAEAAEHDDDVGEQHELESGR